VAACPARDTGAALALTYVSVAAMNLLLRMSPRNSAQHHPVYLPPPYSHELNTIEKVW